MTEFDNILESFRGLQGRTDLLRWKGHNSRLFKVRDAFKMMSQANFQIVDWPCKHICKTETIDKVVCFVWLLAKEVVLAKDNLARRNISLCPRCFLCGEKAESAIHLFLHCKIAVQLWRLFINRGGIS